MIAVDRSVRGTLADLFGLGVLVIAASIAIVPILMALLNSLKTDGEIITNILALPESPQFRNYVVAFERTRFLRSVWNTIAVLLVGITGIVVFAAMAGYKLSRTHGFVSGIIFGLFVMSMLIPFHSIMIPLTRVSRALRLQGTTVGLGIIYIGLGVPLAIFLYHGFVKSVPRELDEAAEIDGCGELRYFATILFPLVLPVTVTIIVLNTLWIWNDFLLPLLMITDMTRYTVLLSTNMLFGRYGNHEWSAILATLILAMLPVVTLFLALQKYVMRGIVDGAIKG